MKAKVLLVMASTTLGLWACGGEEKTDGTTIVDGGGDTVPQFNTTEKIAMYLEGKKLEMTGANIPSHPFGYDENTNNGSASTCYAAVTIRVNGGTHTLTMTPGTLKDAPSAGQMGTCDHIRSADDLTFASTSILIENVKEDGSCFDLTYTFTGFKMEGRAVLSRDGTQLKAELFYGEKAHGHRCGDGAVGASTVTLNAVAFTGNAVQTYVISSP